jgi:hypothetical protein
MLDRFDAAKKRADAARKIYEPLPQTNEEADVWNQFVPARDAWWRDHTRYAAMEQGYRQNPTDGGLYAQMVAFALETEGLSFGKADGYLRQLLQIQNDVGNEEVRNARIAGTNVRTTSVIGLIVGPLLALFLGLFISSGIGFCGSRNGFSPDERERNEPEDLRIHGGTDDQCEAGRNCRGERERDHTRLGSRGRGNVVGHRAAFFNGAGASAADGAVQDRGWRAKKCRHRRNGDGRDKRANGLKCKSPAVRCPAGLSPSRKAWTTCAYLLPPASSRGPSWPLSSSPLSLRAPSLPEPS